MIVKFFNLKKDLNEKINFFLLYGNNEGLINETIDKNLKPISSKNITTYDEAEILNNVNSFEEEILTKSLFEENKLIIINRVSDKILKLIEEIISKNPDDIKIILKTKILEKKSKLRNFFEKKENVIIIPFYEDNSQTLLNIAQKFFKEKKISISNQNISLIVERCRGDRLNLINELEKINAYVVGGKKIDNEKILKITNLANDYNISDLVDSCLAKNKKKTLNILNENNSGSEDNILILRSFLFKLKRLMKIQLEINESQNTDSTLNSFKPPIFWKDKDIIKQQLRFWSIEKIKKIMNDINNIEFLIKKNPNSSNFLTQNFILEEVNKN